MPTATEKLEQEVDISASILTVKQFIEYLKYFDQDALIIVEDSAQPIYLEINKIQQKSQIGCNGKFNTVYFQLED